MNEREGVEACGRKESKLAGLEVVVFRVALRFRLALVASPCEAREKSPATLFLFLFLFLLWFLSWSRWSRGRGRGEGGGRAFGRALGGLRSVVVEGIEPVTRRRLGWRGGATAAALLAPAALHSSRCGHVGRHTQQIDRGSGALAPRARR